jgi:enoyl-CoA hydratase
MCVEMHAQLGRWQNEPAVKAVVVRGAGERAFCAGGDIRALYASGQAGTSYAADFYRDEYRLNARIKHFPKPYVALLHGIVMGGGVGVSVHGSHRIADMSAVFAMPETGIGLFPDVGGSFFLPRLAGETGMYLALTGARLKADDVLYARVATHCLAAAGWEALLERLAAGETPDGALGELQSQTGTPPLAEHRAAIDSLFAHGSVEAILVALDEKGGAWGQSVAATIRAKSPTSLKLTFRQLREGRSLPFDDCMRMEFRMVSRITKGHDFYEGVRATIIDKDNAPHWQPETLSQVGDTDVDAYFVPLREELAL